MRYLLHDSFTNSVKKHPNNTAVITDDGIKTTYRELNLLSNKFARVLKAVKKSPLQNPYIGLISAVNINSIAAIIGTLKIGCAYVPLDDSSPTERLSQIVNNTELDTIIVEKELYEKFAPLFKNEYVKKIIVLGKKRSMHDKEKCIHLEEILDTSDDNLPLLNQVSDDLAYVLHSSGSTGVPKGIMLTHRNARTFVDWMQKEFRLNTKDRVMSRAPFKFDLSIFDIFNTLGAGATLICFDWKKNRRGLTQHAAYVDLMVKESATILYTTPSTLIVLMNRGGLCDAKLSLKKIMYAGEPFPIPQLRKLIASHPNIKIANIYGPTETNIITYYWIKKIPENATSIPLGAVVEGTEVYIVSDTDKRICNVDEVGEIWCRGGTVTIGYLNLPKETKKRSVISPFHQYPTFFWRTGDYGYRDANGVLYYRGRRDHMVKVRGYRIEIGEVESAVAQFSSIDEFVVIAVPDESYGNRLYCYFSLLKKSNTSEKDLENYLRTKLPDYMVPYHFCLMSHLPKTSSGKIDRMRLLSKSSTTNP